MELVPNHKRRRSSHSTTVKHLLLLLLRLSQTNLHRTSLFLPLPRPSRAHRSQLARRGSTENPLLGLLERLSGSSPRRERDEPEAFGFASVLVYDDGALLDLSEAFEDSGESLAGGLPGKAVDEDFPVGDVAVGGFEDGGVDGGSDLGRGAE